MHIFTTNLTDECVPMAYKIQVDKSTNREGKHPLMLLAPPSALDLHRKIFFFHGGAYTAPPDSGVHFFFLMEEALMLSGQMSHFSSFRRRRQGPPPLMVAVLWAILKLEHKLMEKKMLDDWPHGKCWKNFIIPYHPLENRTTTRSMMHKNKSQKWSFFSAANHIWPPGVSDFFFENSSQGEKESTQKSVYSGLIK